MHKLSSIALASSMALVCGQAFAGAATFSGAVNGAIDLSVISVDGPAADDATVLSSTLKVPGSKKDLLIGVSIESGVFTETQVKGKALEAQLEREHGSYVYDIELVTGIFVIIGIAAFRCSMRPFSSAQSHVERLLVRSSIAWRMRCRP